MTLRPWKTCILPGSLNLGDRWNEDRAETTVIYLLSLDKLLSILVTSLILFHKSPAETCLKLRWTRPFVSLSPAPFKTTCRLQSKKAVVLALMDFDSSPVVRTHQILLFLPELVEFPAVWQKQKKKSRRMVVSR